jgi:hypothetical protein
MQLGYDCSASSCEELYLNMSQSWRRAPPVSGQMGKYSRRLTETFFELQPDDHKAVAFSYAIGAQVARQHTMNPAPDRRYLMRRATVQDRESPIGAEAPIVIEHGIPPPAVDSVWHVPGRSTLLLAAEGRAPND